MSRKSIESINKYWIYVLSQVPVEANVFILPYNVLKQNIHQNVLYRVPLDTNWKEKAKYFVNQMVCGKILKVSVNVRTNLRQTWVSLFFKIFRFEKFLYLHISHHSLLRNNKYQLFSLIVSSFYISFWQIVLSGRLSVPENSPAGYMIGQLSTIDANNDSFTYKLIDDGGCNCFSIATNSLKILKPFNYEASQNK